MASQDVLFIVEGEKVEPKLLKKINNVLHLQENINIYSYCTSIYELYEELKLDQDLDVALLLREKTTDKRIKASLSKVFAAIYLIFDFEPHHPKFHIEKLIRLSEFFNDSLTYGMLLINYPMVEAYKHLKEMPDIDFLNRTVNKEQIRNYKHHVGLESKYTDITLYHHAMVIQHIAHHLIKMNQLIKGIKKIPNHDEVYHMMSNKDFIKFQYENYLKEKLFVLSTIYYYAIELKPRSFYDLFDLPFNETLLSE